MKYRMGSSVAALMVAGLIALGGCQAEQKYQGETGTVATYKGRELSAVLPPEHGVADVLAAAEQAMRDRGYTIVSNTSTEDSGVLIARPPRYTTYPRLEIGVQAVPEGTRIALAYQPFGNQEVCRASLNAILTRLGL